MMVRKVRMEMAKGIEAEGVIVVERAEGNRGTNPVKRSGKRSPKQTANKITRMRNKTKIKKIQLMMKRLKIKKIPCPEMTIKPRYRPMQWLSRCLSSRMRTKTRMKKVKKRKRKSQLTNLPKIRKLNLNNSRRLNSLASIHRCRASRKVA